MRTLFSEKFGRGLLGSMEKDTEAARKAWEKRHRATVASAESDAAGHRAAGRHDEARKVEAKAAKSKEWLRSHGLSSGAAAEAAPEKPDPAKAELGLEHDLMPAHVTGPTDDHVESVKREIDAWLRVKATFAGLDRKAGAEKIKKEMEDHLKKQVESAGVFTRVHPDALEKIIKSGRLKTQFETKESKGSLDPKSRSRTENRHFGIPDDVRWEPKKRPVYGYLANDEHGGVRGAKNEHSGPTAYGNIAIKLKDRIKGRTTFMLGDSLGVTNTIPQPVLKPNHLAIREFTDPRKSERIEDVSTYAEAQMHGGVNLSDIDHVVFPSVTDETRFDSHKEALKKAGIPYKQLGSIGPGGKAVTTESFGFDKK